MDTKHNKSAESPEYLRMSLAAAMTLGFERGLFYRNARLYCINLLLTYQKGCAAKCAYCGLSRTSPGTYEGKHFIRVKWPTYSLDDIIERISSRKSRVKRICISMITRKRSVTDTKYICSRLRSSFDIPVSLLQIRSVWQSTWRHPIFLTGFAVKEWAGLTNGRPIGNALAMRFFCLDTETPVPISWWEWEKPKFRCVRRFKG